MEKIEYSWPGTGKLEIKVDGNKSASLVFSPELPAELEEISTIEKNELESFEEPKSEKRYKRYNTARKHLAKPRQKAKLKKYNQSFLTDADDTIEFDFKIDI